MAAELNTSLEDGILLLQMRHTDSLPGPDIGIYAAGVETINNAGDNPDVRVIVLAGQGGTFLNASSQGVFVDTPHAFHAGSASRAVQGLHHWLEAMHTCPKPIVAAVEGVAAGAGFALALACDLIVASHDARFIMDLPTLGLPPVGGFSFLVNHLPRHWLNTCLLTGQAMTAQRLQQLGLVHQLCDGGSSLAQARQLAMQLQRLPAPLLAQSKLLLSQAQGRSFHQCLMQEQALFDEMLESADD